MLVEFGFEGSGIVFGACKRCSTPTMQNIHIRLCVSCFYVSEHHQTNCPLKYNADWDCLCEEEEPTKTCDDSIPKVNIIAGRKKENICSSCGKGGHNKRSCLHTKVKTITKQRTCKKCGLIGHNKRSCKNTVF